MNGFLNFLLPGVFVWLCGQRPAIAGVTNESRWAAVKLNDDQKLLGKSPVYPLTRAGDDQAPDVRGGWQVGKFDLLKSRFDQQPFDFNRLINPA